MSQINATQDPTSDTEQSGRMARLLKRFGIAGFLFFFIKGLLWLIIPAVAAWGIF